MRKRTTLIAALLAGGVIMGIAAGAQAAPLPTHLGAIKSAAANKTLQVRWGGGGHGGGGHRGLGTRERPLGTLIAGTYYGSHPYYGGVCYDGRDYHYRGCASPFLHSITADPPYPVPYPYYSY